MFDHSTDHSSGRGLCAPMRTLPRRGLMAVFGACLLICACTAGKDPEMNTTHLIDAHDSGGSCVDALFCEGFEDDTPGQLPGNPWSEETYGSGAVITISRERAFSGRQAMHVLAPKGASRRGYVAIHRPPVFPAANRMMFGRVMVWLDAAPVSLATPLAAEPLHWTLLQGEGRSADDRYNAIYRLGGELQSGSGLKANYETTPPVRSDCRQHSARALPVAQWACVEWHFNGDANEMQFWLDGIELSDLHVVGRGSASDSNCRHQQDLKGQWLAPPAFQSLFIGWERYGSSANDQNVWFDDLIVSKRRVGCPVMPADH